jgi:hypothetical protein
VPRCKAGDFIFLGVLIGFTTTVLGAINQIGTGRSEMTKVDSRARDDRKHNKLLFCYKMHYCNVEVRSLCCGFYAFKPSTLIAIFAVCQKSSKILS